MTEIPDLRIYVACLAAYNNNVLHGRWISACQDAGSIQDEVNAMLEASPVPGAEEWAIHDNEGFPSGLVSEYTGFERVAELAAFIGEHGDLAGKVLAYCDGEVDRAEEMITDNYAGKYDSLADFAEEIETDAGTDVPERLINYIDWAAMGRDLQLGGDVFTIEDDCTGFHVFWCR